VAGAAGYLPEAIGLADGLAGKLPEILEPEAPLGRATDPELGSADVAVEHRKQTCTTTVRVILGSQAAG
jgi:hypothetical protein